jgi:hypothetical protein
MMKKNWEKRIRKLESKLQSRARSAVVFRYGRVSRLPREVAGERHIVVVSRAATAVPNVLRCEFEERLGPAGTSGDVGFLVYLSSEEENGSQP